MRKMYVLRMMICSRADLARKGRVKRNITSYDLDARMYMCIPAVAKSHIITADRATCTSKSQQEIYLHGILYLLGAFCEFYIY